MKKVSNYSYYLVAFIDILGQKEAFEGIDELPKTEEEKNRLIEAHSKTVEFVEEFRTWFVDFFSAYAGDHEATIVVPDLKKQQFDKMRKSVLRHTRFSDCIQAFVPLQSEEYHSPCINGVFGLLGACGGMLLLSLAKNKSFRAGLDVGIGTELGDNEVYGPGFFNAYTLESKIAQYPRVVIGKNLIDYLMNLSHKVVQLPNQTKEDIELCKIMADKCLKMIVTDLDGHYILDYLGPVFIDGFIKDLKGNENNERIEIIKRAYDFIEKEYTKLKKAQDEKLAIRYFMLYSYFKARMQSFIV